LCLQHLSRGKKKQLVVIALFWNNLYYRSYATKSISPNMCTRMRSGVTS
jgi:hypothetical protein